MTSRSMQFFATTEEVVALAEEQRARLGLAAGLYLFRRREGFRLVECALDAGAVELISRSDSRGHLVLYLPDAGPLPAWREFVPAKVGCVGIWVGRLLEGPPRCLEMSDIGSKTDWYADGRIYEDPRSHTLYDPIARTWKRRMGKKMLARNIVYGGPGSLHTLYYTERVVELQESGVELIQAGSHNMRFFVPT